MIAAGIFLGCVEFLGWNGGVIGLKIDHLLQLLVGRSTALVPPMLRLPSGARLGLGGNWSERM